MKTLAFILTLLISMVLGPIWRGYVLSLLWAWFIVTTFGANPLSIPAAIGLATIVSFLTYVHRKSSTGKQEITAELMIESLCHTFAAPAFTLLFGAIVKNWM